MTARTFSPPLTTPTAPFSYVVNKRHLNTVFVEGSNTVSTYKMRGWDSTGMIYYHWTTSDPTSSPPSGYPSLSDIVIAAILVDAS